MNLSSRLRILKAIALGWCCCLAFQRTYAVTYSIDFQGPTAGALGFTADGTILSNPGALAAIVPPVAGAGTLGLAPAGMGTHGGYEVDALSYGTDPRLRFNPIGALTRVKHSWTFSVDEFAIGSSFLPNSVKTEGAFGLSEASADIFRANTPPASFPLAVPPLPFPISGPPVPLPFGINKQEFDGDGSSAPPLFLVEPNPPTSFPLMGAAAFPDPGDNVDAWDIDAPVGSIPVYFSLDSGYPDPFEPPFVNTGTAAAQGFDGGDVLFSVLGGGFGLFADSMFLGLNEAMGDVDDLDALVLWENGNLTYDPTTGPYSWLTAAPTDMLLFSVRRNSSILVDAAGVGVKDALGSGLEITEGDLLIPVFDVVDGIPIQDGVEGDYDVGIFVNAEALGLSTVRSGGGAAWTGGMIDNPRFLADIWDDDLDALDVEQITLLADGDGDGDVDGGDFLIWQRNFGKVDPSLTPAEGDFTEDFMVDGMDLSLWQEQYGFSFPLVAASSAVPEPATWSLLALCGLWSLRRNR